MTITSSYLVEGMTCGHCVNAVSSVLSKVPNVTDVAVTLDTGEATVTSDAPLDDEIVRAAIVEAGYELVTQD